MQHEKHVTLILVRKQKHPRNRLKRNFVIVCFSVKREMTLEHFDVVTTAWRRAKNLWKRDQRLILFAFRLDELVDFVDESLKINLK